MRENKLHSKKWSVLKEWAPPLFLLAFGFFYIYQGAQESSFDYYRSRIILVSLIPIVPGSIWFIANVKALIKRK